MLAVQMRLTTGIWKLHSQPAATSARPRAARRRAVRREAGPPALMSCPHRAPSHTVTPKVRLGSSQA